MKSITVNPDVNDKVISTVLKNYFDTTPIVEGEQQEQDLINLTIPMDVQKVEKKAKAKKAKAKKAKVKKGKGKSI